MYILLCYFVIVGTSNAVNLTDGLDGLAIVPTIMVAAAFAIFAYVTGNVNFSEYLNIPYIPLTSESSGGMYCHSWCWFGLFVV